MVFSPEISPGVRRIFASSSSSFPRQCILLLTTLTLLPAVSLAQAPPPPATPAAAPADLPQAPLPTLEAIHRSAAIAAYEKSLPAGTAVQQSSDTPLPLSLDDAIARAFQHNLGILTSQQNERRVAGLRLTVANSLLPSVQAQAYTRTQEINLAAMGFKPASLVGLLPPGTVFNTIVKVDTTDAQLSINQQLFNVPAYFLYRASQRASAVANLNTLNVRGGVALQTASTYFRILADAADIATARSLILADQADLSSATQRHDAGVGVRLDVLRSQVQLQNEQQALISAENTYSKDRIALNRVMGLPAGQELLLTDAVPFAELTDISLPDMLALAYARRKDYLSLEAQFDVAARTSKAVRFERLPTVAFGGFYGVLGETRGLYHGVFSAQGSLNFPIFKEAQFRGEQEVADSQLLGLRRQIESLRVTIEQQIRASQLDVETADQLVKVARSNVDLSRQLLGDAQDRFAAGVQDNLPVTDAQAALAQAESRLTGDLYQFNLSKLQLARNVGVIESQYRTYLGH